ncbi:hypothetical protein BLOT_014256 [Blomia tropicalis]|nr:hypothetical protein BLOT_014256 [Blomia tropicalis]
MLMLFISWIMICNGEPNNGTTKLPQVNHAIWIHPNEYAKDCYNAQGKSMVQLCRNNAEKDNDPERLNRTLSTTWETCCTMYEEFDCYLQNAKTFCTKATRIELVKLVKKVVVLFQETLCGTVIQVGWKDWCDNMTHNSMIDRHKNSSRNDGTNKFDLINLPTPAKPEKKCFDKLKHTTVRNETIDFEEKCLNASLTKWDPDREKLFVSNVTESCCAYYEALYCIQNESKHFCNKSEQFNMYNYRHRSFLILSDTLCRKVPCNKVNEICGFTAGVRHLTPPGNIPLMILVIIILSTLVIF